MTREALGDDVLTRRAARGVAAQAAGLVFGAVLLLVVLVTLVVVRGQASATDRLLRATVMTADDVGDPPPGSWLVFASGQQLSTSPGLPAGVEELLGGLRGTAGTRTHLAEVKGPDGREYQVATRVRKGRTVQAVLDLSSQHDQRDRLLKAMAAASALGLVLAGALGVLVGRRAVRPLAEALALQRAFVADASHELRTPLTLLSTRAQVLDRAVQRGAVDEQARLDSHGVVQDVLRLGEVVEDLLVAADPRGRESYQPVELVQLARDVVATATAHATAAHVDLQASVPTGPLTVLGSATALRRALLSLVDNAIDHTPAGGQVLVSSRADRRQVIVAVSDTGPGIPADQAHDVLRRFHSGGHRAGRTHYGLGLALTHDVANRHGGQLRLAPSEVGTTFELVLPAPP